MRVMRKTSLFVKILYILLALALLLSIPACDSLILNADATPSSVCITEVVSSNTRSLVHETLGTPDWIEIYNNSNKTINLEGYGLSDNIKSPHKWTFPAVELGPGEYLIVYATKKTVEGAYTTGFGISKSGDSLYLSDPYYNLIQSLDIPPLEDDFSYAMNADSNFGYCAEPTPGKKNDTEIFSDMSEIIYSASYALRITEVLPNNEHTLAASDGKYYPYAELYNSAESPLLLSNYYLSDDSANYTKWELPALTLPAKSYVLIFFSGQNTVTETGEIHASFKLGSSDDTLCLADSMGSLSMRLSWPLDLPDDIAVYGESCYSAYPTPGADNDSRTFEKAVFVAMNESDPLRINEILVRNKYSITDEDGDRDAWVELYNGSASPISLDGYCLSDRADSPFKWAFPEGLVIEPGGYLLIYLDGKDRIEGYLHTSFSLSVSDGVLLLTNKNGLRQDMVYIDPNIGSNISFGLASDGYFKYFATPTPGAANTTHAFDSMGELSITNLSSVYISEVCAVTAVKSTDTDWIELHNGSSSAINLKGWHITDDPDDLYKFEIPDLQIAGGGYVVINATTKTSKTKEGGVTAPFGISASGETLILTDASGEIRDIFETGVLRLGVSSGRTTDSTARVLFSTQTKGKVNAAPLAGAYVLTPMFSDTSLYHQGSLTLTLSCSTEGAAIYYTTDGSKPTTGSKQYTEPLILTSNAIIRAIAVLDGLLESDIITGTYLFVEPHTLPVVCLSIDSVSFDQVYSVTDRWEKVEREGHFAFYESDGALGTSFPCGLRVNGASTLTMRQKSLSIFLRGGYGQGETTYPFFPENDISVYHSLCIRNSGQDASKARLRDSLFTRIVEGLNIENVQTRFAIVYINGQYWGLYDLNENQNEDYMADHYGVDPDAVDIIRRNETALEGSRYEFKRVRSYALSTDLSNDEKYAAFCEWVDVEYFIDYLIAQTFFANGDMFNQKYWCSKDYSIKWRPVFYDLDLAFGSNNVERNILPSYFKAEGVPSADGSLTNMDIYVGLRKNAGWCDQFCARYVYVVYNHFTPERMAAILDDMVAQMEPEMARHIAKWGYQGSVSKWKEAVSALRNCLLNRGEYALKNLKREFGFSDADMQRYIDLATQGQPS